MAHAHMDRKGFLKGLGVATAALLARPAAKAASPLVAASDTKINPAADLPIKVRPQPHTVARSNEAGLTR